ncbi:hypothetical protein Tco_0306427, partial [Tanacetum coccineum]
TLPRDSPLPGGHTPRSDKGRLKHDELMELVTKLLDMVVAGRKIAQIDIDPTISLVQDKGTSWFQEDVETQEKNSVDTEVLLEEETLIELIEDLGSGEKVKRKLVLLMYQLVLITPPKWVAAEYGLESVTS